LFYGFRLQGVFVIFALPLLVRVVALVGGSGRAGQPGLAVTLLAVLVLAGAGAVGATGWAEADGAGVRWRYWSRHSYAWSDIDGLELQAVGVGMTGVRHLVAVRVHGRSHRITPASDGGRHAREFGRRLVELAAAHGIPVEDGWQNRR
jgi:hypothetical protein